MIDPKKVKAFWDGRAEQHKKLALESLANLEQDADNLKLKIDEETRRVFEWLPDLQHKSILDLGAGIGQWVFRFAEKGAARIVAVEYAEGLAKIGMEEALQRKLFNVEYVVSPAEKFRSTETFDVVFISGLFVYLTDQQCAELLTQVASFLKPQAQLLLRDGTGTPDRYEISDRHSEHLDANYSAIYRTRDEFVGMMQGIGLQCLRDENMFPEGHQLNKYPETRLRLFLFEKA